MALLRGAALVSSMVTLCSATPARAQACTCSGCCQLALPPGYEPEPWSGPSETELHAVMAGGATAAVATYVVGLFAARAEPHPDAIDNVPIVGAIASAARNAPDGRNTPLLLFSAGVQAMGLLVVAAAATDLAALHRFSLEVDGGPRGCGARLTVQLP